MMNRSSSTVKTEHILRIIIDPPQGGAVNMATDEAILESVNIGDSPPTLRFYQWSQPTISLGYFQQFDEIAQQDDPIRQLPIVRRQTGGGAILHDDELTYSLILPIAENNIASKIEPVYQLVHDAFIRALADYGVTAEYRGGTENGNSQRGPFFCFARLHRLDLTVNGDKILGSAQRRIKHAVLQHGSLILGRHFNQQPCAAVNDNSNTFNLNDFMQTTAQLIANQLDYSPSPAGLTPSETARLGFLLEKYSGNTWNQQR